ncbi:histamine H2 receptor [Drosophila nasuta]|uniref:Histamine H2 receptor isoform X1 n=2 Tax=Drosophila albomicans TaxID=7291 RepID=A0A6P8XBS6_DROAB|nr:histamine H2 receptor isoform X1 [Drosophila albomicans]XP_060664485.1 histamine H2 receptor [Drosophila nasuta]
MTNEDYLGIWLKLNAINNNHTEQFTDITTVDPTTNTDEILQQTPDDEEQTSHIGAGLLVWVIINAIIFVFILGGNILTIVAVRTCRNLRSVISNLFILSLAVSDFIVGLALPYHVAFYMDMGGYLGRLRGLCLLRFFLFICACCVSILTLISIAVDRYIAVMYALHYRRYMTRRMAYLIITCNWCLGALVALIPIFWNKWSESQGCEFDEVLLPWYVAGIITPGFVVIWICMLVFYWRIMREASKQAQRLRHSVVYNTHSPHSMLHPDWKSVQIVVFIMGCFTLCWLPYFCVAIAQLFSVCRSSSMIYKTAFSLAIANSALNPIIYSWKNSGFRRAFAQTLCCKSARCCRVDSDDVEMRLPSDSVKHRIDSTSSFEATAKPTKPTITCKAIEDLSSPCQGTQ